MGAFTSICFAKVSMSSRSSDAYCCCVESGPVHRSNRGSWKVSMSFLRRSIDSMRSVVSWSNFGGIGGIVYAGMWREAWKSAERMMLGHVGAILRFRVVAVLWTRRP